MKFTMIAQLLALPSALAWSSWRPSLSNPGDLRIRSTPREFINPYNVTIRFKEPSICETTPGVRSYSGYVDGDEDGSHTFFWFFEARQSPETAPITLWLNGGPGSDSLVGLFQEIGPCMVNPDLTTKINAFSWSQASNLLFVSQPLGVGFSYASPRLNDTVVDTTEKAAIAAWRILQGLLKNLPTLDAKIKSREFHLWTESYGGHYGPVFARHFEAQNEKIDAGTFSGTRLRLATLGIGSGVIDAATQFPYYPKFAMDNTFGIKCVPDDVYSHMNFSCYMRNGCLDQVGRCRQARKHDKNSIETTAACAEATNMCQFATASVRPLSADNSTEGRDNVEGPYYEYSGRNMYDIRLPSDYNVVSDFAARYLNLPATREALGIDTSSQYLTSSDQVYSTFQQSGDYIFAEPLEDLGYLIDRGTRVVLMYGDADYIGNWFGGEAVSLAVDYEAASSFRNASYEPFIFNGAQYGRAREYGNFSFVVFSDAGHLIPADSPEASLELFRRAISGVDLASGLHSVTNQTTVPLVPDPVVTTTRQRPTSSPSSSPLTTPASSIWSRG